MAKKSQTETFVPLPVILIQYTLKYNLFFFLPAEKNFTFQSGTNLTLYYDIPPGKVIFIIQLSHIYHHFEHRCIFIPFSFSL